MNTEFTFAKANSVLDFGTVKQGSKRKLLLLIRNPSNKLQPWYIDILDTDWLNVDINGGTFQPEEQVVVTVTVNTSLLELGSYEAVLYVVFNTYGTDKKFGISETIPIKIKIIVEPKTLAIRIRITEDPLTAQNLTTIVSALNELHTKLWLIEQGRIDDLSKYSHTGGSLVYREAPLEIVRLTHKSPTLLDIVSTVLTSGGVAAMVLLIDAVVQVKLRYRDKKLEIDRKFEVYNIDIIRQKLELIDQFATTEMKEKAAENLLPTLYKLGEGNDFERPSLKGKKGYDGVMLL
jgi:hypothetical protein